MRRFGLLLMRVDLLEVSGGDARGEDTLGVTAHCLCSLGTAGSALGTTFAGGACGEGTKLGFTTALGKSAHCLCFGTAAGTVGGTFDGDSTGGGGRRPSGALGTAVDNSHCTDAFGDAAVRGASGGRSLRGGDLRVTLGCMVLPTGVTGKGITFSDLGDVDTRRVFCSVLSGQ